MVPDIFERDMPTQSRLNLFCREWACSGGMREEHGPYFGPERLAAFKGAPISRPCHAASPVIAWRLRVT